MWLAGAISSKYVPQDFLCSAILLILPGQFRKQIEFAATLPLTDVIVTINTPIPGTESYARAREFGTYDESDWTSLNYWTPVFVPHDLTREFLLAKQAELYRRFYFRPAVLLRQIGKITSFAMLIKLLKNCFWGLRFTSKNARRT